MLAPDPRLGLSSGFCLGCVSLRGGWFRRSPWLFLRSGCVVWSRGFARVCLLPRRVSPPGFPLPLCGVGGGRSPVTAVTKPAGADPARVSVVVCMQN